MRLQSQGSDIDNQIGARNDSETTYPEFQRVKNISNIENTEDPEQVTVDMDLTNLED